MNVLNHNCICVDCKLKQGCKNRNFIIKCQNLLALFQDSDYDNVTVECYTKYCADKHKETR